MGCGNSHVAAPAIKIPGSPEEQAIAQLKVLFESLDIDSDRTLSWNELQTGLQKNVELGALITEAKMNPDSLIQQKLDTNRDGRVTWEEFESHLRTTAIKQVEKTGRVTAAEPSVEEKAIARLKEVFESIDTNKDNVVNQEELARKLSAEHEGFKDLLVRAGLNTNLKVLEQLDSDSDKQITWDEFYDKVKAAAKADVQGHGDLVAATEIVKVEPVIEKPVKLEDCVTYMCCL